MRFSTDWIGLESHSGAEEATLCKLRIHVAAQNASRFFDYLANRYRDSVTVPAVHLAIGLAADWWSIFGGRDLEHCIQRHSPESGLPNIRFRFDGSSLRVAGDGFTSYKPNHRRFSAVGPEVVSRIDAEANLASFIEEVLDRIVSFGVRKRDLEVRWSLISESRSDPDKQLFCEAAGALGVDPYAISDGDKQFVGKAGAMFFGEPFIEFLAGCRDHERTPSDLDWVDQVESRPAEESSLPELRAVAGQIEYLIEPRAGDRPWMVGYRAARAVRDAVGAASNERFVSPAAVARKLGVKRFRPAQLASGVLALVSRSDRGTNIHLHDHSTDGKPANIAACSNNFAFARAIGDAVCYPDQQRSVVNGLHHAVRQATNRAFAAEFLAPVEGVLEMKEDWKKSDEIADEFGVSSQVIDDQIWNEKRIREACNAPNEELLEHLNDAYADSPDEEEAALLRSIRRRLPSLLDRW